MQPLGLSACAAQCDANPDPRFLAVWGTSADMATGIRTEETPRTHADAVRILQGQGGSDVIEVAGNFTARQGAELLPGVLVGKLLGEGMAVSHSVNS